MPWKRIGLIVGFIIVTILLGLLIYILFFKPPPRPPTPPTPPAPPITGLPTAPEFIPTERLSAPLPPSLQTVITKEALPKTAREASGGPTQTVRLHTGSHIATHLSKEGNSIVTFNRYTGTFYRVTPDGALTKMSDESFFGADTITWAPTTDKAVIEFPDNTSIIYSFDEKKQATLPQHWKEFSFSPAGDEFAFKSLGQDPGNRWFAVASSDAASARVLEPLGQVAGLFLPAWSPSGQVAGFFREGVDYDRQKLYLIGLNGENFKAIRVHGRGLQYQWSPRGDRLLHSTYSRDSNYLPELWIVDAIGDAIGDNRRNLSLNTWASKCTFADNTTVYCAVPTKLPEGAGLVPSFGDNAPDHIYKIDLRTDERVKVAEPDQDHTISRIVVSKDKRTLFFVDKKSGNLYKIDLE